MSYIKKLTIEFEDSDGNVVSSDIDGVYVREISIDRPLMHSYMHDRFERSGPDLITIKMEAWGDVWVGATVRPPSYIPPPPKQLTASQKQLPEHKDGE